MNKEEAIRTVAEYVTSKRQLDLDIMKSMTDVELFVEENGNCGVQFHYEIDTHRIGTKVRYVDGPPNMKTRWIGRKEIDGKQVDLNIFFGHDELLRYCPDGKNGIPLVICEGEYDRIAWKMALGPTARVISIPHGATTNTKIISEHIENFRHVNTVVLAFDSDEAGVEGATSFFYFFHDWVSSQKSKKSNFQLHVAEIEFPDGCKDANDVLINFGQETGKGILKSLFAKRQFKDVPACISFDDGNFPDIDHVKIFKTGTPFDKKLVMPTSELVMFQGYSNHGKSEFAYWYTHEMAVHNNIKVCHIVLETNVRRIRTTFLNYFLNDERPEHITRYREKKLVVSQDVEPEKLEEGEAWASHDQIQRFQEHNKKYIRYVTYAPKSVSQVITDETIRDIILEQNRSYGVKVFVVDPFNQVEKTGNNSRNEQDHNKINRILTSWAKLAKQLNVLIIVATHCKAPSNDDDSILPTKYSQFGGSEMVNAPGVIIGIHRHPDDNIQNGFSVMGNDWLPIASTLCVNKNRYQDDGMPLGYFPMIRNPDTKAFVLTDSLPDGHKYKIYPSKPGVRNQWIEDGKVADISKHRANEVRPNKRARTSVVEAIDSKSDF